jgi:hypothetical protein
MDGMRVSLTRSALNKHPDISRWEGVLPFLCFDTALTVHVVLMNGLQCVDSFDRERFVRMSLGSKCRAKAYSSLRAINTCRAIHIDWRFRRQHHYIASRTGLPFHYAPNLGQRCGRPRTRGILAAVQ